MLLVDAFDGTGFAFSLANCEFFDKPVLQADGSGVLVVIWRRQARDGLIGWSCSFDDQVIVVPVPEDDNHVLLAFRILFEPDWRRLRALARNCAPSTDWIFLTSWKNRALGQARSGLPRSGTRH